MKKALMTAAAVFFLFSYASAVECFIDEDWNVLYFLDGENEIAVWENTGSGFIKSGRQISGSVTASAAVDGKDVYGLLEIKDNEIVDKEYRFYYPDSGLFSEGKIINGSREGYWVYYHTTGKKMAEGDYRNNVYENYWQFYDPKGYKTDEIFFSGGNIVRVVETDAFGWVKKFADTAY
ncbi:MAG: toxin-antitoxin system YwqK family antitoxin [Candidatus Goldiibacteriota bacterium]